ncbi:MAG: right-handed parallel beta-helix repeat-containing protein, partial [Myxococcota bacterium]|nr:right-handed parallel beta-helix repeat-containing protein [Myxococcota bacterium]
MPRLVIPFLLLTACADKGETPVDTAQVSDDTGAETDTEEPGCITVDGTGDYATINEAVADAEEGSTIGLCATEAHEEAVTLDKSVTLQGPGSGEFLLVAPTNESGITITADGASVEGLSIETTRSGIVVEGAADVSLSDLTVEDAGNWGVKVSDATDLVATALSISGAGYGGMELAGGSATVSDTTLADNTSYGFLVNEASLSIQDCSVQATAATDAEDGYGLLAEDDSVVVAVDTDVTGSALANVVTVDSDLSLSGGTLDGSYYGVWNSYGAVDLSDMTVTDAYVLGVYAYTTEPITVSGLTVSGDLESTLEITDEDWGSDESGYRASGMLLVSDDVWIGTSTVSGYHGAGIVVAELEDGQATLQQLTLSDNGRHGLYLIGTDATVEDTSVSGVVMVEDQGDELCYYVDRYAGVVASENQLTWSGGSLVDNDGYGITGVRATLDVTGVAVEGNTCGGVMNYEGYLEVSESDFARSGYDSLQASVVFYESDGGRVESSFFDDAQTDYQSVTEYEDDDGTVSYVYDITAGFDIYARSTEEVTISDN